MTVEPTAPTARPRVVVFGHLYQPPRENPWTDEVPIEESAAPFHDWNERITHECYRPNAHAQFGGEHRNNYELVSFDVGPTLTAWMELHAPDVLAAIVAGDRVGHDRCGHGPTIAHPWVHAILPLCNDADRATLVRWGIADFVARFGRVPEGMWLPETAVDIDTLAALRDAGILFTLVAPHQVVAVRDGLEPGWVHGAGNGRPLRVGLPDGRTIVVLPYDGVRSNALAFGDGLRNGVEFARDLVDAATAQAVAAVTLATDMETYGHHHRFGEMALVAALDVLAHDSEVDLVTAAECVATVPASEGLIAAPSAWSCAHGIERWRSDCGCRLGSPSDHNQAWRAPLRSALDALRDAVLQLDDLACDLLDPAVARNEYCGVMLDPDSWSEFAARNVVPDADAGRARWWLELQRHLLMMYSSCGWFFDDAAGHETLIVLRHARRAIEIVIALGGPDLEPEIVRRVAPMYSDAHGLDGRQIWERLALPPRH